MTAATHLQPPAQDTQLPSYTEALAWGVIPPPRPQWAPPRDDPSSGSTTGRSRLTRPRPFSIGNIDATLANAAALRPQSAAGRQGPYYSFRDMSLDAVLRGDSPRADLRRSPITPRRPRSAQGFFARPLSPNPFQRLARPASPPPVAALGGDAGRSSITTRPSSPPPIREEEQAPSRQGQEAEERQEQEEQDQPPPALGEEESVRIPEAIPIHARPAVPPTYELHDPIARTFLLRTPLVYSSTGSSPQTPAYQLDAQPTKGGRPYQLRIRPLDHIESRTLSLRAGANDNQQQVSYDDDHTLYLLQVMQLLGGLGVPGLGFGPSWRVEMQREPKGGASRNLSFIRFEGGGFLGSGLAGGGSKNGGTGVGGGGSGRSGRHRSLLRSCKFWYMTKKTDRELKGAAHEWKLMSKYGYSPEYDWNKRLLFTVRRKVALGKNKGYEWKDGKGRLVAVETAEGRLDITGTAAAMSDHSREALLACWVGKAWAAGALTW